MPTLLDYALGDVFTVKVYKRHVNRPGTLWANTYEMRAISALSTNPAARLDAVKAASGLIAAWERNFHTGAVEFDRYVVSSWVEDGQPYNPATFDSTAFYLVRGNRAQGAEKLMPLETCLLARKSVDFGRDGRNLYRGCLFESDVASDTGSAVLSDPFTIGTLMETADLMADLIATGFEMVLKGNGGADVVRRVSGVVPVGVSMKQLNNRYYDRVVNGTL